jgi:hypothetical protein
MSAVTRTGHTILPARRRTVSGLAGLDHLAQVTHQAVKRLVFRHGDMPRPREIDAEVIDNGRRAPAHDYDTVGQERSFSDAVGHENHRLAIGLPDAQELDSHFIAGDRIEGTERLVHQENAWIVNERSANRYTLPHAARQLPWQQAGIFIDFRHAQQFHRPRRVLGARKLEQLDGKQHILQHRSPRQQNRALENDPDLSAWSGHFRTLYVYLARAGSDQPGDHHEQRAFPAATWAQYTEKFAIADVERHLADRFEVAIALSERGDAYRGWLAESTRRAVQGPLGPRRRDCRWHHLALLDPAVGRPGRSLATARAPTQAKQSYAELVEALPSLMILSY